MNLFFELVVACFRLSCLRHQEYVMEATGTAFYYQKPSAI